MSLRTPLAKVRGLGSAKEGSDHFWIMRLTSVANIVLGCFLVGLIVSLIGKDYATVRAALANPFAALGLLLLILSGTIHMRLGMQTIIEDYVASEGRKIVFLMLNTFFSFLVALASIYSILKLSFGA